MSSAMLDYCAWSKEDGQLYPSVTLTSSESSRSFMEKLLQELEIRLVPFLPEKPWNSMQVMSLLVTLMLLRHLRESVPWSTLTSGRDISPQLADTLIQSILEIVQRLGSA